MAKDESSILKAVGKNMMPEKKSKDAECLELLVGTPEETINLIKELQAIWPAAEPEDIIEMSGLREIQAARATLIGGARKK